MKSPAMDELQDDLSYKRKEHYLDAITNPLKEHFEEIIKLAGENIDGTA